MNGANSHKKCTPHLPTHLSYSLALNSELFHLGEVVVKCHDVSDDGLLIWVLCENIYKRKWKISQISHSRPNQRQSLVFFPGSTMFTVTRLLGLTIWSHQASALQRWRRSGDCGSDWISLNCYSQPDQGWERNIEGKRVYCREWETEQTDFMCVYTLKLERVALLFISPYRCLCMRALKAMPSFQLVVKFVMLMLGYL